MNLRSPRVWAPLALIGSDTNSAVKVVAAQLTFTPTAGICFFNWFDVTVAVPLVAYQTGANLRDAVLRDARLQEVGLSQCEIAHIFLGGAKLDDTQLRLKQLDGAIGEELAGDFERAAQGYLALERNFEGLGDHDAASWAYRRRRRMQKRGRANGGQGQADRHQRRVKHRRSSER